MSWEVRNDVESLQSIINNGPYLAVDISQALVQSLLWSAVQGHLTELSEAGSLVFLQQLLSGSLGVLLLPVGGRVRGSLDVLEVEEDLVPHDARAAGSAVHIDLRGGKLAELSPDRSVKPVSKQFLAFASSL